MHRHACEACALHLDTLVSLVLVTVVLRAVQRHADLDGLVDARLGRKDYTHREGNKRIVILVGTHLCRTADSTIYCNTTLDHNTKLITGSRLTVLLPPSQGHGATRMLQRRN